MKITKGTKGVKSNDVLPLEVLLKFAQSLSDRDTDVLMTPDTYPEDIAHVLKMIQEGSPFDDDMREDLITAYWAWGEAGFPVETIDYNDPESPDLDAPPSDSADPEATPTEPVPSAAPPGSATDGLAPRELAAQASPSPAAPPVATPASPVATPALPAPVKPVPPTAL